MELTKERLEAWRNDEVTKEIFSQVTAAIQERMSDIKYKPGVDALTYAVEAAFNEGVIIGMHGLLESCAGLKFKFSEEESENA